MSTFILDIGQWAEDDVSEIPRRARAPLTTAVGLGGASIEAYTSSLNQLSRDGGA